MKRREVLARAQPAAIAAYLERQSCDPMTGKPGLLRKEWRVRLVADFNAEELRAAWGDDWRRYSPGADYVLEMRYIRRGTAEPWQPFQSANTFRQALEYVDDNATAVSDVLAELQGARRIAAEAEQLRKAEERLRESEAEADRRQRAASNAAFDRLRESRDGIWARRWNGWVAERQADGEYKSKGRTDPDFMRDYNAVWAAVTVPAKRRAIKTFLKAHAPEWFDVPSRFAAGD